MTKDSPSEVLEKRIAHLEQKRDTELLALKYQLHETGESLKPANLVKSAVQDVATTAHVRSIFKKAMIGLVVGIIAKGILSKKKNKKPFNLMQMAIKLGINLLISNRYRLLKSAGTMAVSAIASNIIKKRRKKNRSHEPNMMVDGDEFDATPDMHYSMR